MISKAIGGGRSRSRKGEKEAKRQPKMPACLQLSETTSGRQSE
jgi:hypothetical protein